MFLLSIINKLYIHLKYKDIYKKSHQVHVDTSIKNEIFVRPYFDFLQNSRDKACRFLYRLLI